MNQRDRQFWIKRLPKLYEEAKARSGQSLTIYSEVSDILDYLEGIDEPPSGMNLAEACDNLAGRLHQIR